jgi:hypothetical protein
LITLLTTNGSVFLTNNAALRQYVMRWRAKEVTEDPLRVRVTAPSSEEVYVDALMRMSDLYLVGIENEHCGFYFKDSPLGKRHGNQCMLGFTGHYSDLGFYRDIELTAGRIEAAIAHLSHWRKESAITNWIRNERGHEKMTADATSLLILVLIVSEATRFRDIWKTVGNTLDNKLNTPLTMAQIDEKVRRWGELSKSPKWWEELDIPNR